MTIGALPDLGGLFDPTRWDYTSGQRGTASQPAAGTAAGAPGTPGGPGGPSAGNHPNADATNENAIDPNSQESRSARAVIDGALGEFGLQSLSQTVWGWYLEGRPIDQIMLDLKNTPEYQARFPAMRTLADKGHAITEAQYINLESTYTGILHAAGMPTGFYDSNDDFTALISGEVSPGEFQDRVKIAQNFTYEATPEVRDALQALYGISGGDLAAYWLDPNKALPLLQQKARAATLSGIGTQTHFGQLGLSDAERLASLGVTDAQGVAGMSQLALSRQLFSALPGEAGFTGITTSQQLGAAFAGDSQAQAAIEAERSKRIAAFSGDAEFAASREGKTGLAGAR